MTVGVLVAFASFPVALRVLGMLGVILVALALQVGRPSSAT